MGEDLVSDDDRQLKRDLGTTAFSFTHVLVVSVGIFVAIR